MLVKSLRSCPEFIAGDETALRELLHPDRDAVHCRCSIAHARLAAGRRSLPHALMTTEIYYILSGKGRMEIDGAARNVIAGDLVYIPPQSKQCIESLGPDDLQFLCIVDPAWQAADEQVFA